MKIQAGPALKKTPSHHIWTKGQALATQSPHYCLMVFRVIHPSCWKWREGVEGYPEQRPYSKKNTGHFLNVDQVLTTGFRVSEQCEHIWPAASYRTSQQCPVVFWPSPSTPKFHQPEFQTKKRAAAQISQQVFTTILAFQPASPVDPRVQLWSTLPAHAMSC